MLKEAKRVMKREGSIIIGLVPKDSPWGAYYEEKKRKGNPFYSRARFHSFEEIRKILRETGLTIAMIKSTLIQRPGKPCRAEEPVEGYTQEAGFLCIEAKSL